MTKTGKSVRQAATRRGKKRSGREVHWVPEVAGGGELVLKRQELADGEQAGEMHYPFAQGLTFVARRWRNLMNDELRTLGQSQARWGALYWISVFGDSVNQTELADRIGVEQPTLGRVLRDLEREGLIERVVAADKRARVIRLTPAAKPLMRQISRIQESVRERLLRGIERSELQTCMSVFARILANVDRR
jgi:MarR family transcriptional regulator, transcriptional regulator for hemolysin